MPENSYDSATQKTLKDNLDTSSDKYYKGQTSVPFAPSPDRHGRPGEAFQSKGTPVYDSLDTSTDKYYAPDGPRTFATIPARVAAGSPRNSSGMLPREGDMLKTLQVRNDTEARTAAEEIASLLSNGRPQVFVDVVDSARNALNVQLDFQITKGYITDSDKANRVKIGKLADSTTKNESKFEAGDDKLGELDPESVPYGTDHTEPVDGVKPNEFASFVKGDQAAPGEAGNNLEKSPDGEIAPQTANAFSDNPPGEAAGGVVGGGTAMPSLHTSKTYAPPATEGMTEGDKPVGSEPVDVNPAGGTVAGENPDSHTPADDMD